MKPRIYVFVLAIGLLFSCNQKHWSVNNFDDKILFIENDPQLYLSRVDTTQLHQIRNGKEATDFILSALTLNYMNNDCYPTKEQLQKSIRIFKAEGLVQQQLEAQYLLAGVYRKEKDLPHEVHVIEEAGKATQSAVMACSTRYRPLSFFKRTGTACSARSL